MKRPKSRPRPPVGGSSKSGQVLTFADVSGAPAELVELTPVGQAVLILEPRPEGEPSARPAPAADSDNRTS
jgi:hypothetical protein